MVMVDRVSRIAYGIILIVSSDGGCLVSLLPDERLMACGGVVRLTRGYRLELAGAAKDCACPKCGVVSRRVHARYTRRVRDLPVQGKSVIIRLRARKFLCDNQACPQRVFCERFGEMIAPFARMTARLEAALTSLALLSSARNAERIGRVLGYTGSVSTLLRCAHRYQPPVVAASHISVDDFAFRRGHTYGTIIVDLSSNKPIELLCERSVESLMAYLEAHPEVRVVARDRDPRYAEAISMAAPNAMVIVDRWHLLRNLTDAFVRLVANHSSDWRKTLQTHLDEQHADALEKVAADDGSNSLPLDRPRRISIITPRQQQKTAADHERRQHLIDQAHELRSQGWPKAKIARHLHLDPGTVTSYLKLDTPPDHARRRPTPSLLDEHLPFLQRRWREGCRNASQLTRELTELGYQGTRRTVTRYVRHWRTDNEDEPDDIAMIGAPIAILAQPNKLAWNLLKDEPDPNTQQLLECVSDAEHQANLARAGLNAIRHHDIDSWNAWCRIILQQPNSPLKRFVTGLKTDYQAVINALTQPFSNGPTEGNVNRLKLIKRTMYGRASFHLLRNKVLYQPTES